MQEQLHIFVISSISGYHLNFSFYRSSEAYQTANYQNKTGSNYSDVILAFQLVIVALQCGKNRKNRAGN